MKIKSIYLILLLLISCDFSGNADKNLNQEKEYRKEGKDIISTNDFFASPKANNLNKKGVELGLDEKYEEAEKVLLKALNEEPNNPVILNNIGLIHLNRRTYNTAIKYFSQALEVSDSTSLMAANNLGLCYYHQLDYARALNILDYAILNSKNDNTQRFTALLNRLMVNIKLKDCEAIHNDRKAIEPLRNNNKVGDFKNRIHYFDKQIKKLCKTSTASIND